MIWKLLIFLYNPDYETEERWKRKYCIIMRSAIVAKIIRKDSGAYMTPMEQMKKFAEIASSKGQTTVCFLFNEGKSVEKTSELKGKINIPIIQLQNGKYAATSLNVFGTYLKHSFTPSKIQPMAKVQNTEENEVKHQTIPLV